MLELTPAEVQKLDICIYRIRNPKINNIDIAHHFDVSERTVDNAIAWGKKRGVFRVDASERIEKHIQEVRKHIRWLDREIRKTQKVQIKYKGENIPVDFRPNLITGLSRERRETHILLMELEGIYKKLVNVEHSGSVTVKKGYIGISPDDWDESNSAV